MSVCLWPLLYSTQCALVLLYCNLWLVWLYHIFPHYLMNGTIFGKKDIESKIYVLIFPTNMSEIFLILRRTERKIFINLRMS